MSDAPRIPSPQNGSFADPVRLTIPGVPAALPIARILATAVGAHVDLTIDDIDDLTIAVEEALIALIEHGAGSLDITFELAPRRVGVVAAGDGDGTGWPPPSLMTGLGWKVLTGLAEDVTADVADGPRVRFSKRSMRDE